MSAVGANNNKARIDMKHGFMKSIIQNQVDRDNYDKEVKAKQCEKHKPKSNKTRKPDISVYVPPTKLKDGQNPLFQLEFENRDGEIFTTQIYACDKGNAIATKIGQEMNLPPDFVSALEERIDEEILMRLPAQDT
ncbi:hypothetical protein FSP39_013023 [Pinctada imbricata]|uniref:Uncharacterized protein n=1 Tax=Pinctada imbricata TaxID=66713 RepID=A0AA88Y0U2_PINIB|nr:hypothetical protein FSP39_013023 [Pinctada imbricata]